MRRLHEETKLWLSFEPRSISFLVSRTRLSCCDHSETMLLTTVPHLLSGLTREYRITHPIPVAIRKMVRECSCKASRNALPYRGRGWRLSFESFSKNHFVAMTVTTTPVQSATALPKKEPVCDFGSAFQ